MAGKPWTMNERRYLRMLIDDHPGESWLKYARLHGHARTAKAVRAQAGVMGLHPLGMRRWQYNHKPVKGAFPEIGAALETIAARRCETIEEIALRARVSIKTIGNWKRGLPSQLRLLVQWAQAAETTVAEICTIAGV